MGTGRCMVMTAPMAVAHLDGILRPVADRMAGLGLGVVPVSIGPGRVASTASSPFDLLRARQTLLEEGRHADRALTLRRVATRRGEGEAVAHVPSEGLSGSAAARSRRYAGPMERAITGYHRDDVGDWVAELSCGHGQHVRHRPPFQLRAWALEAGGRAGRLGTPLDCPLCDQAELPDGLRLLRSSPEWDEHTMPRGLLRAHRTARGTWGRITVREGRLRFVARTEPELVVVVGPESVQAIPPEVEHQARPLGPVRFSIDFLSVLWRGPSIATRESEPSGARGDVAKQRVPDAGGEPACWAHLLCPGCGAVLDGGSHLERCRSAAHP